VADLRENESKTLLALRDAGGRSTVDQIVQASGLTDAAVMRAALTLGTSGLVAVHEDKRTRISLNDEARFRQAFISTN
jgi:DNA-binding IclR family transcriptional regulator